MLGFCQFCFILIDFLETRMVPLNLDYFSAQIFDIRHKEFVFFSDLSD